MSGNEPALIRPPQGRRLLRPAGLTERAVLSVLTWDLALVVLTQKVAVPFGGRESQISLAFIIHFATLGFLASRGALRVSGIRLILFACFATVATVAQVQFAGSGFSFPSLILMLATSAMFLFVIPLTEGTYQSLLNRFVWMSVVAAGLVMLDWGVQLLHLQMPDLEVLIPKPLVYYEYNYIQPLQWGSPWMKPNGVFFLETSHVSQFIGMGLVIEVALFRRLPVAVGLGAALLATTGVTGMLLVAASVPFLLARAGRTVIIATLVFLPVGLLAANQVGLTDSLWKRTSEFSQDSSSGYNRFVLPVEWSVSALTGPAEKAWFGTGAGSMPKAINDEEAGITGYTWPPYTKVTVEYGSVALMLWLLYLGVSLFGHGVPFIASWVCFFQYNFLNGSLNVPIHSVYCALLCAGYIVADRKQSARERPSWRPQGLREQPALLNDAH